MSIDEKSTSVERQLSGTDERRKRINRMKKTIIITCIVLVLIPIIVCFFLLIRVNQLEKDIDNLLSMKESGKIVSQVDSAGGRYLVLSAGTEEKSEPESEKETESETAMETTTATKETVEETTTADTYTGRRAYLTFDDGPSVNTIPILDTLDRYGIKGTFFVIGKADEQSMQLMKEIVNRGHSLGLHSFSHDYGTLYASLQNFSADLTSIHDLVKNATGKDVKLFRFPGGSSTTTTAVDIREFIKYLNDNHYRYVDWNVSSQDATGKAMTAEQIASVVVSESLGCNNAYILMHDAGGKESTVQALPAIIEQLQANGFRFYPIDDSVDNLCQHVKSTSVQ